MGTYVLMKVNFLGCYLFFYPFKVNLQCFKWQNAMGRKPTIQLAVECLALL